MGGCKVFKKNPPPPRAEALDPERFGGPHASTGESDTDGELIELAPIPRQEPVVVGESRVPTGDPDAWRPDWWRDEATRNDGKLSVFARGEGADLLSARRTAMERARDRLKMELAGSRVPDAPEVTGDSVRLPDGRYRAFVRLRVVPK